MRSVTDARDPLPDEPAGDETPPPGASGPKGEDTGPGGRGRAVRLAVLVVLVLVALLAAFAGGRASVAGDAPPADDGADAGFLRDMQQHHAQAVEMSLIVRDNTTDEAVRTLAYDIATTQQHQVGQMFGWLDLWGLSQYGEPMAWMSTGGGHDGAHAQEGRSGAEAMPGMATRADLQRLRGLRGREAELLFLELMIPHHRGGVEMAQAVLERSPRPQVREMADKIIVTQKAEITLMERMIAERRG